MSRQPRRPKRSVMLRLWMERAAPVAAVCALMVGGGLVLAADGGDPIRTCQMHYEYARTAADTLAVDSKWSGGRGLPGGLTCGRLRREGMLEAEPTGNAGR